MRTNVHIDPRCLITSLVPSVVEEYHKEVSGYLIGGNARSRMKVISAYPFQTDERKQTWVMHGNLSAVKRVNRVMKTMRMSLVGGFHTHPEGPSHLSRSDVDFIQEKMDEHSLESWFELLVAVTKKEYTNPHRTGWKLKEHMNKLNMLIKPDPWTGYSITLSGHWVRDEGDVTEARLWTSKRYSF